MFFQVYFAIFFVFLFFYVFNEEIILFPIVWIDSILLKKYWFIQCYLILLAFSSVLNKFIDYSTPVHYRNVLASLFIIQVLWGWLPYASNGGWYDYGYSPLSFFFLYLLARYIRKYVNYQKMDSKTYMVAFFVISLLGSLFPFCKLSISSMGGVFLLFFTFCYNIIVSIVTNFLTHIFL